METTWPIAVCARGVIHITIIQTAVSSLEDIWLYVKSRKTAENHSIAKRIYASAPRVTVTVTGATNA